MYIKITKHHDFTWKTKMVPTIMPQLQSLICMDRQEELEMAVETDRWTTWLLTPASGRWRHSDSSSILMFFITFRIQL